MAKSAATMADKYKSGLSGAQKAYTDGVQGTTKDPAALAIAAKDKWQQKLQEAFANGSFEAGLSGVTQAAWKQATIAGAAKLTAAAPTAAAKYARYAAVAAPMQAQFQQQIDSMPSTTEGDMDARMLANVALQRSLKGIMRGKK